MNRKKRYKFIVEDSEGIRNREIIIEVDPVDISEVSASNRATNDPFIPKCVLDKLPPALGCVSDLSYISPWRQATFKGKKGLK